MDACFNILRDKLDVRSLQSSLHGAGQGNERYQGLQVCHTANTAFEFFSLALTTISVFYGCTSRITECH